MTNSSKVTYPFVALIFLWRKFLIILLFNLEIKNHTIKTFLKNIKEKFVLVFKKLNFVYRHQILFLQPIFKLCSVLLIIDCFLLMMLLYLAIQTYRMPVLGWNTNLDIIYRNFHFYNFFKCYSQSKLITFFILVKINL